MERQPRRPVEAIDRIAARETRDQREQQGGHPRAGQHFVDEGFERRHRVPVGDVLEVAVAEEHQADRGEVRDDDQRRRQAPLHVPKYSP
jgi:hypothetical protein